MNFFVDFFLNGTKRAELTVGLYDGLYVFNYYRSYQNNEGRVI